MGSNPTPRTKTMKINDRIYLRNNSAFSDILFTHEELIAFKDYCMLINLNVWEDWSKSNMYDLRTYDFSYFKSTSHQIPFNRKYLKDIENFQELVNEIL